MVRGSDQLIGGVKSVSLVMCGEGKGLFLLSIGYWNAGNSFRPWERILLKSLSPLGVMVMMLGSKFGGR